MADEKSKEVELRTPEHGGGALRVGNPGNKGGGRTPSALRRMALKKGPKMLKVLAKIADDEEARDADRVAAAREMLRIGMGQSMSNLEVRDKVQATIAAAERMLPEDMAAQLIYEMRGIWLGR